MAKFAADATVVGGGIAGLWAAKELIDRGLSVNVLERSSTLADGATTKNEGWLHAGTYHAVSIESETEIESVVASTQWSHDAIIEFAPESIDHATTFALTLTDEMTHKAVSRWKRYGVDFNEVRAQTIPDASNINLNRISGTFEVKDKSVNSRIICQKLAQYIFDHGGNFFTRADFVPVDNRVADMVWEGERHTLRSDYFVITVGNSIQEVVERITGTTLLTRFFKAHLLVTPRFTDDNFFYLEAGEVGLMNHGGASIVGINRDGIEQPVADLAVSPRKQLLIYEAVRRLLPTLPSYGRGDVMTIVCNKPDITGSIGDTQSLDVRLFKPIEGYVCAMPGKMTMAPHLAKSVADSILSNPVVKPEPPGARDTRLVALVSQRPVDRWLERPVKT